MIKCKILSMSSSEIPDTANPRFSARQRQWLALATSASLVVGTFFLRDFLILIIIAAIVAYLFNPLYQWLILRKIYPGTALLLTFLVTLLFIVIPLTILFIVTVAQIRSLLDLTSSGNFMVSFGRIGRDSLAVVNETMQSIGINYQLSETVVINNIKTIISNGASGLLSHIAASVTGLFSLITSLILYIFVFFSLLRNQQAIRRSVVALNPLGEGMTDMYLHRMGSMTKAMVRGQLIIALVQGLLTSVGLYFVGLNEFFFFFVLLFTVLSVVPLGAGIISIPMGIIMIALGNVWQGMIVVANHLLVVTNIDNVLKPKLVPKDAKLDSALTMLSVFAGLRMFGFAGIVIGPVLMIVIVTTIEMYLRFYVHSEPVKESRSTHRIFSRLLNKLRQ